MVQLNIVKGDIEDTLTFDSFDKAIELLRILTGGKNYNSIHKNRMVFGEGKDTMIITTTNIPESSEADIKELLSKINASKSDNTNESVKSESNGIDRQKAINDFKIEYNKFAVSLAYRTLIRDISFSEVRERVLSNQSLSHMAISQDSGLLTLRGFKEYIGLTILTQPSNGSVGISISKNLKSLVDFIDNKFRETSIKEYKDNAIKSLSALQESSTLPGVSNIPDNVLTSGVIDSDIIKSQENLEFLYLLGFKEGKFGIYYPINYNGVVPLNSTNTNTAMGAFNNISQQPDDKARRLSMSKNSLLKFRQSILRFASANYIYNNGMEFFPEESDKVSDNFYNFNLYDKYKDISQALTSIRVKISDGGMEIAKGGKLDIIRNWVTQAGLLANKNSIYVECAKNLKDVISEESLHWLQEMVANNYNSKRLLQSFELVIGDNVPSDFLQVVNCAGARITQDNNNNNILNLG